MLFDLSSLVFMFGWLYVDGGIVAVADVIHITHAAVATVSQVRTFLSLLLIWLISFSKK